VEIQINAVDTQTVQMHEGDWVAYLGNTTGIWVKGMCMRWTGVSWEAIPVSADGDFETNPYVAALMDLTEGAGNGTFMSILVRDLIAKTAMIEYIASHKLHIQSKDGSTGAIYGGGYDENGNPTGGPGFYLGTDGKLKAVDGEFSGTINAAKGVFTGDIISGPLIAMDATSGATISKTFSTGTRISEIIQYFNPSSVYVNVSGGSYNGKSGIIRLGFTHAYHPGDSTTPKIDYYIMYIYYSDGSTVTVQDSIPASLTVLPSVAGKVFKIIGLPSGSSSNLETNAVYEDGGILKIKK
jgi:hypothetical protein